MALDEHFRIENLGKQYYTPSKKHHFSMYLDGDYYKLYLRKSEFNPKNELDLLDSQILLKYILEPILGISDPSNDKNIHYLPEAGNEMMLQQLVDSRDYAVGFGSFPVSVTQLKKVADENLTMPPKSSYIEPKLRSGLTIYELS